MKKSSKIAEYGIGARISGYQVDWKKIKEEGLTRDGNGNLGFRLFASGKSLKAAEKTAEALVKRLMASLKMNTILSDEIIIAKFEAERQKKEARKQKRGAGLPRPSRKSAGPAQE